MKGSTYLPLHGEVPEGRAGVDQHAAGACAYARCEARAGTGRYREKPLPAGPVPHLADLNQRGLRAYRVESGGRL